jgi:hypothetical protein
MDEKGFRKFIKEAKRVPKGLSEETIRSHVRMVKEFEAFIRKKGPKKKFGDAKASDVKEFIKHLTKDGRNTFDNLIGLLRYARFAGNKDAELSLLIILDGGNILGILCDTVKKEYGEGGTRSYSGTSRSQASGRPSSACLRRPSSSWADSSRA